MSPPFRAHATISAVEKFLDSHPDLRDLPSGTHMGVPYPLEIDLECSEPSVTLSARDYEQPFYRDVMQPIIEPRATLPENCIPSPENPRPYLLHYGLPIGIKPCFTYAIRAYEEGRLGNAPNFYECDVSSIMKDALKVVSNVCDYDLGFVTPVFPPLGTCDLIQLYSNYLSREEIGIDDEEVKKVVAIIKRELKLDPKLEPMWYYDTRYKKPQEYSNWEPLLVDYS